MLCRDMRSSLGRPYPSRTGRRGYCPATKTAVPGRDQMADHVVPHFQNDAGVPNDRRRASRNSCASGRRRPSTIRMSSSTWATTARRSAPTARRSTAYRPSLGAAETDPPGHLYRDRGGLSRAHAVGRLGERQTIVIAGAGIGGLTAALALAERGFRVDRLRARRRSCSEVGAGIQLSPNAGRVLAALGLETALAGAAAEPQRDRRPAGTSGRLPRSASPCRRHAAPLRLPLARHPPRRPAARPRRRRRRRIRIST